MRAYSGNQNTEGLTEPYKAQSCVLINVRKGPDGASQYHSSRPRRTEADRDDLQKDHKPVTNACGIN